MNGKKIISVLASASLIGTLAVSAAAPVMAEHSKTFSIAFTEGIIKLDPHDTAVGPGLTTNRMVFDSLLKQNNDGSYEPSLADEYSVSEDGLEWTLHIREGVTFHDGEVLNADDVVCTYERLLNEPTLNAVINYWTILTGVEKIDDYTVKLTVSEPSVAPLMGLATTAIIPNEAFEAQGTALFTDQIMTGSGPWKFDEWVDGQYIHFLKNEDYWGGNDSYFDDVYIRFVPESSTAISAQITGEVDAYYNVSGIPADLMSLYAGSEDRCELLPVMSSQTDYLGFQCGEDSVFNDVNVRKAFSMAIDREGIVFGLLGGGGVPTGIANSQTNGFDPDLKTEGYTYDPEAAKELLASTNYNGEEITISSVQAFNNMALAVADMVNAVGFNCKAEVIEAAALADIRSTGDYDAFIVTALFAGNDIYQFINWRIMADAHHSEYKNDDLMSKIAASNTILDTDERNEALKEINKILAEECAPMITLTQHENVQSVNYGVTGVNFTPDGFCYLENVSYDPSLEK